jgi:Ni,Fe-hydrogenase III large subunit/Ni,Fe-hydrogenase III component G
MIDGTSLRTRLAMAFAPGAVQTIQPRSDEMLLAVPIEHFSATASTLRQEFGATFVDLFGVDQRATRGVLQVHLICALDTEQAWLHLTADLDPRAPGFPSLADVFPASGWYEREIWEELGIEPRGHPLLRRLRLPPDWPEGVYPAREGFTWQQQVPRVEARFFELAPAPEGVVDYPLGPVRSGIVESGHYTLRTVGEELVDAFVQLFYKHRGVERRAVGLPIEQVPLVAERISGTSAFAHSLALCQALEQLAGVEVPIRSRLLRTLLAELERLYNHLGYQADLCQATGLVVAQAQFDLWKERVLRLNAQVSGHRYLFGMNIPGGLRRDLSEHDQEQVRELVLSLRKDLTRLGRLLFASASHRDRLEATGILTHEQARAYSAIGPIGRASGIDRDARRDHPYAAYADLDLEVPVLPEGDALARARLRLYEAEQSLHLIEQILDHLKPGVIAVPLPRQASGGSAMGWAESPHGESLHWVQISKDGTVQRYRARPASFANWQAFSLAIPGHNILTDFPVIEQSFGLSFAGADC